MTLSNAIAAYSRMQAEIKERMISDALRRKIGEIPPLTELVGRMKCTIFPDGCEVYEVDGKPFLQLDSGPKITENMRCVWRYSNFREVPSE